ncbi:hypothetical protein Chor_002555 [Crotalus horridus]
MALAWRRCPTLWRRQASPAGYATLGGGSAQPQRRGGPKESPAERRAQKELIYGNSQRSEKMDPDQDWTSVYPTAASFKPSAVPLPIRMGYPVRRGVAPAKEGNLELLKIPNFLHLTPVAIKKHCAALKEWRPCITQDQDVYHVVKLSSLNLDDHARKKFIKLVGERYCGDTDSVTITTDRCPFRKQNYDYAMYLLTVLFHESWKIEPWEKEITEADMLEYVWENSASEKNALRTLLQIRAAEKSEEISREELLASEVMQDYKKSMVLLKNEGETEKNLLEYKNSVKRLLNIQGL